MVESDPIVASALFLTLVGLLGILGLGLLARSQEEIGSLTWLFLATCLGVLIVGLEGIVLAVLGCFRVPWIATCAGVSCLILWAVRHRFRSRLELPRTSRWDWVALGLLVATAMVFAPPHENVIVGRDPGVYTNTGIHLARTGRWTIEEPFLNALPETTRTAFDVDRGPYLRARMFGFYWLSDRDEVVSQFLPFYTVWMAFLELILGPGGGRWSALLFTVISGLGLYSIAARSWHPRAGIVVLLLHLANPAILWNARSANAEVPLRALLLFLVVLWQEGPVRPRTWGSAVVFAAAIAAAVLTKLDMLIVMPAVVVLFGLSWLRSPSEPYFRRAASLSLLTLGAAAWFLIRFAEPYLVLQFRLHQSDSFLVTLLVLAAAAAALLLQLLVVALVFPAVSRPLSKRYRAWTTGFHGLSPRWQRALAAAMAAGIVLLGYLLPLGRSDLAEPTKLMTFARATWYVTPVAWWLAGIGTVSLLRKRPSQGELLLLGLLAASMGMNLSMNMVDHVWTIRRFMPIAIPGVLLLAAGGASTLADWRPKRTPALGWALALGMVAAMLYGQTTKSKVLLPHKEYPGTAQFLTDLSRRFSPGAVILIDPEDFLGYRSILASFMGPHLWLRYDLQPLYMVRPLTEDDWQAVQRIAAEQEREVYYVGEIKPPMAPDADSVALEHFAWDIEALERTLDRFPSGTETFHFELNVWRLASGSGVVRYSPRSLSTQVGELQTTEGGLSLVSNGSPGFISYGPYHKLPKGAYVARFGLKSDGQSPVVVRLDATPVGHPPLAESTFTLTPQSGAQYAELAFSVRTDEIADTPLEMRALLPEGGRARLTVLELVPAQPTFLLRGVRQTSR